ncbi:MAG: hypothetical protein ACLFUB_01300 [Cyclobacteriaceae bacterium]
MANRKLQKLVTYQFTPQTEVLEHLEIKELLDEGWDVKHFQVNPKSDAMGVMYITALLEHTSKNPQSDW